MMIAPQLQSIIEKHSEELSEVPLFVCSYSLDPDIQIDKENGIAVLITEITDNPSTFGSDKAVNKVAFAQIQLFYANTYEKDTSEIREKIEDLLEQNGWYLNMDSGIERDPDTGNLFNTSHYRKEYKKERKVI